MSLWDNITLLVLEIWILAAVVLALHRLSRNIGLAPLFVLMGGLCATLQLQRVDWVSLQLGGLTFNLNSHTILPVLLFGLLVIYEINGTIWARGIAIGMLLVTVIAAIFQILLSVQAASPGGLSSRETAPYAPSRILIASIIVFASDLVLIILVYQSASNMRSRFPSRFAGLAALLATLSSGAILFSILAYDLNNIS
jgi:hypothetical protein